MDWKLHKAAAISTMKFIGIVLSMFFAPKVLGEFFGFQEIIIALGVCLVIFLIIYIYRGNYLEHRNREKWGK